MINRVKNTSTFTSMGRDEVNAVLSKGLGILVHDTRCNDYRLIFNSRGLYRISLIVTKNGENAVQERVKYILSNTYAHAATGSRLENYYEHLLHPAPHENIKILQKDATEYIDTTNELLVLPDTEKGFK